MIAPPKTIPTELFDAYTLGGQVSVKDWYHFESSNRRRVFTLDQIEEYREMVRRRENAYYGVTDSYLYEALKKYPIAGKTVAILGSLKPWYECICLEHGATPITIEYNEIDNQAGLWECTTVDEYKANPRMFDCAFSISSFEHDGLGRYGDPLNPEGDLDAMRDTKSMIEEDGHLFLSVPVGMDTIWWTAHRVYGQLRMPKLFKGWNTLEAFGFTDNDLIKDRKKKNSHQPVFVLENKGLQ